MVGLDTNVLVRHLVRDDAAQAELARQVIEEQCRPHDPGVIPLIVLCELVWVLTAAYRCTRVQIAAVVRQVLVTDCFAVQDHTLAWAALRDYTSGNADYADCLIGHINRTGGCRTTLTFDTRAASLPHFTLLG
jgi:predicted nucleic-acid-binding protein